MPCLQHFLEGVLSGGATRTLRGDATLSRPVWESQACPWPQDASCSSSASTSRNFRNHQVNTSFEKEEGMDEEEEIDESKLESGLPDDDERTECNLDSLKLGNQTGKWSKEKEDIKWAYDNSLKGQEVQVWWPGRTDHGECNNLHDEDRGCWFRAKLLNDPYCTDAGRCIHFAAHDGEPTNTFSCPTWIRDPDGIGCRLPRFNWQACPMKFEMKRVDTGIPQEFKLALSTPCSAAKAPEAPPVPENQFPVRDEKGEVKEAPGAPPDEAAGEAQKVPAKDDGAGKDPGKEPENAAPPDGHCNGPTNDKDEARMIMDLKKNAWYRCNEMMRCEPWDIRKIIDEENPQCGKKKCGPDEQCFVHRVSALQSTYQCVKTENAMVIADGDDAAKLSVPFPLVICSFQQLKAAAPRRKTLRRFL